MRSAESGDMTTLTGMELNVLTMFSFIENYTLLRIVTALGFTSLT